jgi:flagellar motor switch protein FliN/FliY
MERGTAAVGWLSRELTSRCGQALEGMTGEKPDINWSPFRGQAEPEIEWWEQPLSYPEGALVYVGITGPDAIVLGGTVLEAAGVEATPEEAKSTYFETLNQTLSGLGQALAARLRKEVTCPTGRKSPSPGPAACGYIAIRITVSGGLQIRLLAAFDPILVDSLEPEQQPLGQAAAAGSGSGAALSVANTGPAAAPQGPARTMDLLYDVELPVSVSFGRAQLPLRDVIKLTSGSIVELNRSVTEPVEVIVNNCVIARGEVVVIEGNYGVRIDQIISRQDRLRTLK